MRRVLPLIAACAWVLQTANANAASTAPPGYRVVEQRREDLVVAGAVFIGISVVSLGYGVYRLNTPERRPVLVNDGFGSEGSSSSGSSTANYAIAISALSGLLGTTLLTVGLSSKRRVLIPSGEPHVSVVPTFGGLALTGAF